MEHQTNFPVIFGSNFKIFPSHSKMEMFWCKNVDVSLSEQWIFLVLLSRDPDKCTTRLQVSDILGAVLSFSVPATWHCRLQVSSPYSWPESVTSPQQTKIINFFKNWWNDGRNQWLSRETLTLLCPRPSHFCVTRGEDRTSGASLTTHSFCQPGNALIFYFQGFEWNNIPNYINSTQRSNYKWVIQRKS